MEISVELNEEWQAVVADASGMINYEEATKLIYAAASLLNSTGLQRCFFDVSKTHLDPQLAMTEMFIFVSVFKSSGISKSVRMAALYTDGEDFRMHLEKSMKYEGFNLKHFKDKQEALNWLCR